MPVFRSRGVNKLFYICLGLVCSALFLLFVVTPLVFRSFPGLLRGLIFSPDEEIPENLDYTNPESFGFVGARNFYLKTKDGAELGVWHTLPKALEDTVVNLNLSSLDASSRTHLYDGWLEGATVFLYLHGSAGTRTSPHRLRVYHLINQLDYHVVTLDYRGYGDSSLKPMRETDLIEDSLTVFSWIKDRVVTGNIFFWGHSLGTGVAAHLADILVNSGVQVRGLVLEAPFNNMAAAVSMNPLAEIISFLPWFHYCFIQPLYDNDLSFETDTHLQNISTPTLLLHAEDDKIFPYWLASKLYVDVAETRDNYSSVRLVVYGESYGYGHYNIALAPKLNSTIRKFVVDSTAS